MTQENRDVTARWLLIFFFFREQQKCPVLTAVTLTLTILNQAKVFTKV